MNAAQSTKFRTKGTVTHNTVTRKKQIMAVLLTKGQPAKDETGTIFFLEAGSV